MHAYTIDCKHGALHILDYSWYHIICTLFYAVLLVRAKPGPKSTKSRQDLELQKDLPVSSESQEESDEDDIIPGIGFLHAYNVAGSVVHLVCACMHTPSPTHTAPCIHVIIVGSILFVHCFILSF